MVLYKSLNSEWTGQYLYTCYSTHQTLVVEWGVSHSSWRWENCHTIWIFNCFLFWENKIHLLIPGFVCYCSPDLLTHLKATDITTTWLQLKIPKHSLSWTAGFSFRSIYQFKLNITLKMRCIENSKEGFKLVTFCFTQ